MTKAVILRHIWWQATASGTKYRPFCLSILIQSHFSLIRLFRKFFPKIQHFSQRFFAVLPCPPLCCQHYVTISIPCFSGASGSFGSFAAVLSAPQGYRLPATLQPFPQAVLRWPQGFRRLPAHTAAKSAGTPGRTRLPAGAAA